MGRRELRETPVTILQAECPKKTCAKDLNPLESSIRNFYLSQEGTAADINVLHALLEPKGFQIAANWEGNIVESLTWPDMLQDFDGLDRLVNEIIGYDSVPDEELAAVYVPHYFSVEYAAVDTNGQAVIPTMRAMDDDSIPRSRAHKDTPHVHEMKVLGLFWSDGLSFKRRFWGRLFAATHDLGKTILATGDHHQYHAYISYLMLREYLRSRKISLAHMVKREYQTLTEAQIRQTLLPVRYHHGLELIQKGIITEDELLDMASTTDNFEMVIRLAVADAYSVEDYKKFSIGHAVVAIEALTRIYDRKLRELILNLAQISPAITSAAIIKAAEKQRSTYLEDINSFVRYLIKLVEKMPQASPWLLQKIAEVHTYLDNRLSVDLPAAEELGALVAEPI
ncbi:MAG: hypothetical protein COY81_03685 [Candidatus Pacebacteria bacterium CG_4_10_14_0_8_um_filter_43_12]|nr:MAG: hypothetical protein COU66_02750 [Candidatus Pacebacteria bacterium CG10_big_fil_rev_8_21_14_0_10_44_11]PIY79233.1 MAG: hypothetical protein COY81_03685 [Candidatus Pacebacteria bacterium CG_4_10_14_0_8_um_filter_43_12]